MSLQEINQLRRDGRAADAYEQCRGLLAQNPDDRDVRIAMAWCLKSVTEDAAKAGDAERFAGYLEQLADLRLAEIGEQSMANRFIWDIKTLFDSLRLPAVRMAAAARIAAVVPRLDFVKPNKYYSMLIEQFARVRGAQKAPWPGFVELMDSLGWENFRPEDYQAVKIGEGRSLPALVERVVSAYYKGLMARNHRDPAVIDLIERFIPRLAKLAAEHPEYRFTLYQQARLLLSLGRKADALEVIRPFVRRCQSEFWVWSVLAETADDPRAALSCLCRALECRAEPQFLGQVRVNAALAMHALGLDGNARAEIRALAALYKENGWHIPAQVREMVLQPWYQAAQAPQDNRDLYRALRPESDAFLFIDSPETPILIRHYQHQRRMCGFVTADHHRGFFFTRGLRGRFVEHTVALVRFEGDIRDDERNRVVSFRVPDDPSAYEDDFFRSYSGTLRRREGQAFGFVDNIYVDGSLIGDIPAGSKVTGRAELCYNKRRQQWSFTATSIKKKE